MKILFVSWIGEIADLALRCYRDEGHEVRLWIKSPEDVDLLVGLVPRIVDWKQHVRWADLVVFDSVEFKDDPAQVRASGKPVIGGTAHTSLIESDRHVGQEVFKKLKLPIAKSKAFSSWDDGINYIQEHPQAYVIKPDGTVDKAMTYVGICEDGSDAISKMEIWK